MADDAVRLCYRSEGLRSALGLDNVVFVGGNIQRRIIVDRGVETKYC